MNLGRLLPIIYVIIYTRTAYGAQTACLFSALKASLSPGNYHHIYHFLSMAAPKDSHPHLSSLEGLSHANVEYYLLFILEKLERLYLL